MLTPEQIQSYRQQYKINPIEAPTPTSGGLNLGISDAFKSGISKVKEGYNQSRNATNPLQFVEGGIKTAAGAFGAAFSPLAPVGKPIEKLTEKVSEKVSDIPAVQNFAQTQAGQNLARGAEDVSNLAGVVGGVAGAMALKPTVKAVGKKVAGAAKPAVAGTGRALKATGESSYGVTVPPSEGTARALQT